MKKYLCYICFEEDNTKQILPCKHDLCIVCYTKINKCPFCRATIKKDIVYDEYNIRLYYVNYIDSLISLNDLYYIITSPIFSLIIFFILILY